MKYTIFFLSRLYIKLFILLLIQSMFYVNITGQVPIIQKEKCFGGNDWDIPYSLKLADDTCYIVFGATQSTDGDVHENKGNHDLWILKLTSDLDTIWTKSFGGSENEWCGNIQQTKDGGYILCGETYSSDGDIHGNHGNNDAWVIKLNANGDTIWTRCYGGSTNEFANAIIELPDEGYIFAGGANSTDGDVSGNHGGYDLWFVKLNLTGDTIWTRCYGGSGFESAESLIKTNDGAFVAVGSSSSTNGDVHGNHGSGDYYIIKINTDGDTLWTRCYGGSKDEGIFGICQTSDDGFIVTGYTLSNDGDVQGYHDDYDAWVMRLNSSGNIIWNNCFGGSLSDYTTTAIQTIDGDFLFTGYAESNDGDVCGNHGDRDAWLIKLDDNGDTLLTRCMGGTSSDEIQDIIQISDGYIFAGFTYSVDGDIKSERHGGSDFWIVKLTVDNNLDVHGQKNDLIAIYPNPVLEKLLIDDIQMEELALFDLTGKILLKSKEHEIDMTPYNSGIYFVKLFNSNGQVKTIKLAHIQ